MSAPPPVFVWVRATVDWGDDDGYLARVDPAFHRKIAVWNGTFTVPYNRFRAALREIAALNHSRVEGAVRAAWDEIPEGALVLPVDDDDWFAPDAATAIQAARDPATVAIRWPSTFLEIPTHLGHHLHLVRRKLIPSTPHPHFCATNNYAVVKRPEVELLAGNHMRASEALANDPGVRHVDRRLSLMNRTLASQTTIGPSSPSVTRGHLLRKYLRYRGLYQRAAHRMPAWAEPYVERMAALMDEVRVQRRGRRA